MKSTGFEDYIYFVYLGNNKTYGFRNYTDSTTGQERGYCIGYDKHQQPIFKEFVFDHESRRQIRVHKNERDKTRNEQFPNGQSAADFLRNSPECVGSPNGRYIEKGNGEKNQVLIYFKEVNEAKDAKLAVDSSRTKIDAQRKALELKGLELIELASLIGIFSPDEEILTMKVLDYASNRPNDFLKMHDDPTRKLRALIRRCIHSTVLTQDGPMIKWEGKVIGADEDEAVSNLLKDDKLKKAIESNLAKFGS